MQKTISRKARRRPLRLVQLEERVVCDTSAPAILQLFEASHRTVERRAADILAAGYGAVWTPPPGRAEQGNLSVGYDPYDRFDLGSAGNPTLYGTESGMKYAVSSLHRIGASYVSDLVWNHSGYATNDTSGFYDAGGYPGLAISLPSDVDGDFHSIYATGDYDSRLAGLIDIAQDKNYQFIRNPVPGFANNIRAGTTPAYGRLANVPLESNRQYYPDQQLTPIMVYDPATGQSNIPIYPFNTANPQAGDPVAENALGYLMRQAQWMVQSIGVDGFRLDAVKHYPTFVLNYFDRAVYHSSTRPLLDGSTRNVFAFGEAYDSNRGYLQTLIRKDINPASPGTVGGNRDVLDFPLYFSMQDNLSGNGLQNNWNNVVNASQDYQDDGYANNGSEGYSFVQSADNFGPYLANVAYAYTLMRPGNAIVYENAKEFGTGRDFPKDGRGDALGGYYGDTVAKLVNIRATHPDGDYVSRYMTNNSLVYERQNSALVVLSNRIDAGYDSVTVQTSFPAGTPLYDLTGNSADPVVDPNNDFPEVIVVNADGTANLRIPRNKSVTGVEHDKGYFVYAPVGPQGSLSFSGVSSTIAAETPTAATNGTARLSNIKVVTGNTFTVTLNTNAVTLIGSIRDHDADGDNALIRVDDGRDVNGSGGVDFTTPGSASYGFENITTIHTPGFTQPSGAGTYSQTIDVSGLSEGIHYVTIRAYRHRTGGGPVIFTDFKQAFYVDRAKPVSTVASFDPVAGVNENRRVTVRSGDGTANNVHVFLDLPASLTDAQVVAMIGGGSQASQVDHDVFTRDFSGVTSGNHVITVVTFEESGNSNVQRLPGYLISTNNGAGLGDLNFNGVIDLNDVNSFRTVLNSTNSQFNAAADFNGDGRINNSDLLLLYPKLVAVNAAASAFTQYRVMLGPPAAGFTTQSGSGVTLFSFSTTNDGPALTYTWDLSNAGTFTFASGMSVNLTSAYLNASGATAPGTYALTLRATDGTNTLTLPATTLRVASAPTVTSVVVNDGSAHRSFVNKLTVAFDQAVTLGSTPFTVVMFGGSSVNVAFTTALVGGATVATLTFPGGPLIDGRYTLTVVASQVHETSSVNLAMASNRTDIFSKLFGDANGDGTVDLSDFVAFRAAYGSLNPALVAIFDSDGDGQVNLTDFVAFRGHYGQIV